MVGYTGRLCPKGVAFFKLVEEMVAKAKYMKGCHILAEMTTQLNQND